MPYPAEALPNDFIAGASILTMLDVTPGPTAILASQPQHKRRTLPLRPNHSQTRTTRLAGTADRRETGNTSDGQSSSARRAG